MQRRLGKRMLSLLLVMLAVTTACEKKRRSRFVQGDGEYVYNISEFKGATYTLKSGKKRTPGVTTRADQLIVTPGSNVMRSFDSVEFEIDTDLGEFTSSNMNNFDFYGKEDTEYKIQTDFTEEKLVFFQIAAKEDIPTHEMTYAENIGNGLYRVPLFGLPLKKVVIERIKDDRGKSTNQIKTIEKKFLSEATHFSTNVNTPAYFESELKLDMLPASFFDEKNEWFYEWSVVDKPIQLDNSGLELGIQLNSGKVRFAKTNNSVLLIDTNVADEAVGQDAEKLNVIFEIPVQWMDYRLVKTGEKAFLKEEAFKSIEEGARFWKDREFALLQLDRVLSIDAASTNNIKIKKLEVGEDYFSFVIYDSLTKYSLHYSFAKKNEVVPGKVYPREDFLRFGFFDSRKELYSGNLNGSESTVSRSRVQNRMLPPNRTVTFHITENTPTDPLYLEAIQEAINGWNWAFGEAAKGTEYENDPIKVVLDLSKPVANGDARYHKVSFYGYEIESGLLGYGPSVTDRRNGEIFSSTNHIYLRNYRESIIVNLVNYIRYRLGAYNGLSVDGIDVPDQILAVDSNPGFNFGDAVAGGNNASSVNSTSLFEGALDLRSSTDNNIVRMPSESTAINFDLPDVKAYKPLNVAQNAYSSALKRKELADKETLAAPDRTSIGRKFMQLRRGLETGFIDDNAFRKGMFDARQSDRKVANSCDMLAATSLTFKEIEDVCGTSGTEFSDYVGELQSRVAAGENVYRLDSERDVLLKCAQKLMKPTLVATLAHEFGHNFGLRHNFQGSADRDNFAIVNGKYESRTASVMDYSHADADRGTRPAPYDIAAIRYGYYDSVLVDQLGTADAVTNVRPVISQKIVNIKAKTPGDLRPIEQRVAESEGADAVIHPFAFCTDDHIAGYPSAQIGSETPFCERWDQGADPVTKVRAGIDSLVTSLMTSGSRFDMEGVASPAGLAGRAIGRSIGGIRNVYDKYRYDLYRMTQTIAQRTPGMKKIDDPYFDDEKELDDKSISDPEVEYEKLVLGADYDKANALVADLRETPKMATEKLEAEVGKLSKIAQYKVAAEIAKDFFLQLAFSQADYCLALHLDGDTYRVVDVEPLATTRTSFYRISNGASDVYQCEGTSKYFEDKNVNAGNARISVDKVLTVGNAFNSVKYSSNTDVLAQRASLRTGNAWIRRLALAYMAPRSGYSTFASLVGGGTGSVVSQGSLNLAVNNFFPAMLDGRTFRKSYKDLLNARVAQGVSLKDLVNYANKKLTKAGDKNIELESEVASRRINYYEEEADFLQEAWSNFQVGALSPRTNINTKTSDTLFASQQLNQFVSLGGPASFAYLVANGSTAYYALGEQSTAIINSYNETNEIVEAIQRKQEMEKVPSSLVAKTAEFDKKIEAVLLGYSEAQTKLSSRYQSLNDVLFQVRICVMNTLVKEAIAKDPTLTFDSFVTLKRYADATSKFSIPAYCEAARATPADQQLTAYEATFKANADTYLKYALSADNTFFTEENLQTVLDRVGLPRSPSPVAQPATTLTTLFKSNQLLGRLFGGPDYSGTPLVSLEYKVAMEAISKINPSAGPVDYAALIRDARKTVFTSLLQDEPVFAQLRLKRDLMFRIVTSY